MPGRFGLELLRETRCICSGQKREDPIFSADLLALEPGKKKADNEYLLHCYQAVPVKPLEFSLG